MITALVIIATLGALSLPTASAAPTRTQSASSTVSVSARTIKTSRAGDMTSVVHGSFGKAGVVRGSFKPVRFIVRHGDPYAYGILHARLIRGNGSLVGKATRRITIPVNTAKTAAMRQMSSTSGVSAAATSCDILNLVLGPLDLNLLGLKVHLNRVVLHITATPGPGNLLGNLLCAVAGLLDGTGLLNSLQLTNVLNKVLNLLSVV